MAAATSSYRSEQDDTRIHTYTWPTSVEPVRGVVQIAHGLAEHGDRYARFAAALNDAGFHAVASDHRGHGRSIVETPGDFGAAGFAALWADIEQLGESLRLDYPEVPLLLFAHSMGSFAAQHVLIERSDLYQGVVLSGTSALDTLAAGLADAPAGDLSVFNAGFEHRTGYEWLSRDEAEVDTYVANPLCGFDLPESTVPALFTEADKLADPHQLAHIRSDLPLLLTSGSDDPLAGGGQLIEQLASRYREAGLSDVTVTIYPGARHEILNETNRDDVTADVVRWMTDRASLDPARIEVQKDGPTAEQQRRSPTVSATPVATLKMITLDCADPEVSASFWSSLLGWSVLHAEKDYAMLQGPSSALGFGRVADYAAPAWPNPNGSKQFHFDLAVDDLDAAARAAVELGASLPDDQPGDTWRVLLDPAGHPFCLTKAENWG